MSRPTEPEFLIQWRVWYQAGPPKCCHSCEHYDEAGRCEEFDMEPPESFASARDVCAQWQRAIPF